MNISTNLASVMAEYRAEVTSRISDQYVEHGYADEMPDGTDLPNDGRMRQAVYDIVSGAYAADKDEKSKVGLTKGELYARTFPNGPGAESGTADGLDDIDAEVRETLIRRVWNLTKDTPDGFVQKRLDGVVLIRTTIVRDRDLVPGVFVTDDVQLLLEESLVPGVEALVRRADRLRDHAAMLVSRQPALEAKVVIALAAGVKRANSAARLAIESGSGSDA